MKKFLSLVLSALLVAGVSMTAYADTRISQNMDSPVVLANGRMAYDDDTRTIASGKSWTSYQYYLEKGDYFGCGIGSFSGNVTATIKYSSSVGGSRSNITSKTFKSGGSMAYQVTKSGYYNIVLKNNASSAVSIYCYVTVN